MNHDSLHVFGFDLEDFPGKISDRSVATGGRVGIGFSLQVGSDWQVGTGVGGKGTICTLGRRNKTGVGENVGVG